MIRRKTAVAVLIAVIVGAAFAAYTFRPRATNSSVAVNEPNTDTGNPGTGTGTTPSTPPTPPAKASQGPKHDMCVHENDHIPDQARVHGAPGRVHRPAIAPRLCVDFLDTSRD